MEPLLTWRYFLIPEGSFEQIQGPAEELDKLRNRELNEEESVKKEKLIDEINELGEKIAWKSVVYDDVDDKNELTNKGTITEELVFRMDDAREVRKYSSGFYFPFLVYIQPDQLQEKHENIQKIFDIISNHDLLKREFLGKSEYLSVAREIFEEIRQMYRDAFENKCGIVKTDKLRWVDEDEED